MLYELASNSASLRRRVGSSAVSDADHPPATAGANKPASTAITMASGPRPWSRQKPIATRPPVNAISDSVRGAGEWARSIRTPNTGPPTAAATESKPNTVALSPWAEPA